MFQDGNNEFFFFTLYKDSIKDFNGSDSRQSV